MHKIIKNSAWLMAAQIGGYLVPLIELPFLARMLSPAGLGQILKCQAIALSLSLLIEYGFNYSALRRLATIGADKKAEQKLMGAVVQAKIMLSAGALLPLALLYVLWPAAQRQIPPLYAVMIALSCLAFGFSPLWYFQAKERLAAAVASEISTRLIYLGLLVTFIRQDSDAPTVMALQVALSLLNTGITSVIAITRSGIVWGRWASAWDEIQQGWHLFVFKGASLLLGSSSLWVLGSVAGTAAVSFYGGAEKIVRAATGLSQPVLFASYPKFNQMFHANRRAGQRWLLIYMAVAACLMLPCVIIVFCFAPAIIGAYLGANFIPSVGVLKILSALIFIRIAVLLLGTLWLLPAKQDKAMARAALLCGAITLVGGGTLGFYFGGTGMAWAVLLAESLQLIIYLVIVGRTRRMNAPSSLSATGVPEMSASPSSWP